MKIIVQLKQHEEESVKTIAIFEGKKIRRHWNDLKKKLLLEGSQLSKKIGQLKILSSDGKKYLTDIADTETMFRIIVGGNTIIGG